MRLPTFCPLLLWCFLSRTGVSKNRNYNTLFRTTYYTPRTTVLGQIGFRLAKTPKNETSSTTAYTPEVYPSSEMYSLSDSRGNTFSGTAFFSHKFNDKNSMDWQIAYDYSDNSYHRSYSESAMDNLIRSNTKEYLNNFETRLNYRYQLNSKSSLGLFVWETYMKSNARYAMTDGDNSQKLDMSSSDCERRLLHTKEYIS